MYNTINGKIKDYYFKRNIFDYKRYRFINHISRNIAGESAELEVRTKPKAKSSFVMEIIRRSGELILIPVPLPISLTYRKPNWKLQKYSLSILDAMNIETTRILIRCRLLLINFPPERSSLKLYSGWTAKLVMQAVRIPCPIFAVILILTFSDKHRKDLF